jgi:predicted CXXCH cytochrome family protein
MRGLLAVIFCQLVLCGPLLAAQQSEIIGAVAYTEIIQFDYTKDGARNNVQFWLEFKGSPVLGDPEDAGYKPESGAIHYYLFDMDNKKQVDNWLMGFSMMEEPPPSGPYPMTDIHVNGNTATFSAFGMSWTVIDGGEGYTEDVVTIDDGFKSRKMKMHGGDLSVNTTDVAAIATNKSCTECHKIPTTNMLATGGKHATMSCEECHVGHPPEEEHSYTGCMECHEPHSAEMGEESCAHCHRAHTATKVAYSYNMPSQYCVACHQESMDVLAASQSKHSGIACALCHQETHKATVSCQHCHGGPHPEHVMKKIGICAACHHTAHDLESARVK